jgi:hypothetical protein
MKNRWDYPPRHLKNVAPTNPLAAVNFLLNGVLHIQLQVGPYRVEAAQILLDAAAEIFAEGARKLVLA